MPLSRRRKLWWESERRLSQRWPLSPEQMVGDHARSGKQT
jgi:antitoxin component HigA of HigAB toxin-antitoxin module